MEKLRKHHISFKNAYRGIFWAFDTQPNFKIHLLLSFIALFLGFILEISGIEMLLIIFCIVLGLGAEMINTSIEAMTDLITIEWRKEAKIAKDVSAGMMLVIAIGTLIVGFYIFIPKIIKLLFV